MTNGEANYGKLDYPPSAQHDHVEAKHADQQHPPEQLQEHPEDLWSRPESDHHGQGQNLLPLQEHNPDDQLQQPDWQNDSLPEERLDALKTPRNLNPKDAFWV